MEWDREDFEKWLSKTQTNPQCIYFSGHIIDSCVSKVGVEKLAEMVTTQDTRDVTDYFYPHILRLPRVSPYRTAMRQFEEYLRKNNIVCKPSNNTEK